jgi:tetratricopeptide (TPR) repeat protein
MGEAWATLGFVLARTGHRVDALAAARRAVMLEPDNWRHHLRLASVGWGEERLRAAGRTLALLPGFPLAHFLAATVHVARQALAEAVRELTSGIDAVAAHKGDDGPRFTGVALHWLLGLIRLAQGDVAAAVESFERELALEGSGHLYARECAANTWYAKGAVLLRQGDQRGADAAFEQALQRVPGHRPSVAGLFVGHMLPMARAEAGGSLGFSLADVASVDGAMGVAIMATWLDDHLDNRALPAAIAILDQALASAEPGSEAWVVPVEPLLNVPARRDAWAAVLARLQARAT